MSAPDSSPKLYVAGRDVASPPADNDPVAHTEAFFDALYEDAPAHHHTLLWTLPDKASSWLPLSDVPAIATRARELADAGRDVYCSVSAAIAPGLVDTRIKSANASGIYGMWADIDIADPDVHKKWNLPPSIDGAMSLLEASGAEPTMIVHSGHGLQAWWLFHEFWAFDSEDERLAAAAAAQRWNATLQYRAAEKSWVIDSTFDLARVMRVPGTLNRKGSPVMPVRLIHVGGPRYLPDDLERFCVDGSMLRNISPTRTYVPDEFDIDDTMQPDFERFQALTDNSDLFATTWKMKRKDLPDGSPSAYEFSLAVQAVQAGWEDKEIASLFLAFRRTHKLDVSKALRRDYVLRTIANARDRVARDHSTEELDEVRDQLEEAKASGDDEQIKTSRRAALDTIGQQLGLEVLHFIKYLSDPPQFALVTPTSTIPLGGADGILTWAKFRQSVWETVGHSIDRFKAVEWDRVTSLIPAAWEEQDVGAEATERGEVAAWLAAYLSNRPATDTVEEAAASEYPFRDDEGRVCMFGPAFRRWLYLTYQERVTNKELGRRLRAFGCEPDKVNVDEAGKRTSRGIWRLPPGVVA